MKKWCMKQKHDWKTTSFIDKEGWRDGHHPGSMLQDTRKTKKVHIICIHEVVCVSCLFHFCRCDPEKPYAWSSYSTDAYNDTYTIQQKRVPERVEKSWKWAKARSSCARSNRRSSRWGQQIWFNSGNNMRMSAEACQTKKGLNPELRPDFWNCFFAVNPKRIQTLKVLNILFILNCGY